MLIFVTGGAGFIGSNFINYMLSKYPNYKIVCLDKLTYAADLNNIEATNQVIFEQIDIVDRENIYNLFDLYKPDIVVNFAAETHVDRSIANSEEFLRTNILGTSILLDACNKYGTKRFHQVSTDEVYGDLPLDRPDLKFSEMSELHASSPYSASKAAADLLTLAYFRTYKTPVTISRCSNNYGPNQYEEKLIPLAISQILNDQPVPVYGTGLNVRDWIYVEDHCKAIDLIIHKGTIGEIYNIGANNEKSNLQVVSKIIDYLGKGNLKFVEDRKGHDLRYAIDFSKIKQELDWIPEVNFEKGLERTVDYYKNKFLREE